MAVVTIGLQWLTDDTGFILLVAPQLYPTAWAGEERTLSAPPLAFLYLKHLAERANVLKLVEMNHLRLLALGRWFG